MIAFKSLGGRQTRNFARRRPFIGPAASRCRAVDGDLTRSSRRVCLSVRPRDAALRGALGGHPIEGARSFCGLALGSLRLTRLLLFDGRQRPFRTLAHVLCRRNGAGRRRAGAGAKAFCCCQAVGRMEQTSKRLDAAAPSPDKGQFLPVLKTRSVGAGGSRDFRSAAKVNDQWNSTEKKLRAARSSENWGWLHWCPLRRSISRNFTRRLWSARRSPRAISSTD